MRHETIHLLHLTGHWLRWAKVEAEGRRFKVTSRAELTGEPAATLEEYAKNLTPPPGRVLLYDGRPRYHSFTATLPAAARCEIPSLVGLRIRQELGLEEPELRWAASVGRVRSARGLLEVRAVMARREGFDQLAAWRERHGVKNLWVGADVTAISGLLEAGWFPSPVTLVNTAADGSTHYELRKKGELTKSTIHGHQGKISPQVSSSNHHPQAVLWNRERSSGSCQRHRAAGYCLGAGCFSRSRRRLGRLHAIRSGPAGRPARGGPAPGSDGEPSGGRDRSQPLAGRCRPPGHASAERGDGGAGLDPGSFGMVDCAPADPRLTAKFTPKPPS